jgi:nucleoside-diphosphate-sugar epimerase
MSRTIVVTGFPTSFLAARLVRALTARGSDEVICLVHSKFEAEAMAKRDALEPDVRARVHLVGGDVAAMDLGLSGREFLDLATRANVIHHCAAATYPGVEREAAERLNVDGVREVIELAREARHLSRLVAWSTALVSGGRKGWVREEELVAPSRFRNVVEETRFLGERIVRQELGRLPITILRPANIVGDSRTGEIDRYEGPYLLVLLMLSTPVDLSVPLPGRGDVPLNLVPIDYVIEAGLAIAEDARSLGRTFHLVDPEPATVREVFTRIASATGRPSPRGFLPTQLATTLLRAPGLEKLANVPRTFLEQLATDVAYDARNAREILAPLGLRCPRFSSYVDVMVEHVKDEQSRAQPGRAGRARSFRLRRRQRASHSPVVRLQRGKSGRYMVQNESLP